MAAPTIPFDDGGAYEAFMGAWSRLVGERFLHWLALPPGLRWADVGCGNGAFTEAIDALAAPASIRGLDPSEAQVAFARRRLEGRPADFSVGDAMALPWPDASVDVAVMALVVFFVPEPSRGVAEMARVVRPGGSVSAYAWNLPGGGFPYQLVHDALLEAGLEVPLPPRPEASSLDALRALWQGAGLVDVETCTITVERRFDDVDAWLSTALAAPQFARQLAALPADDATGFRRRLKARCTVDASGGIAHRAWANAVRGARPATA